MFFCHICDCGKSSDTCLRAHAHLLVIFSIQEARSWNLPELKLVGHVCYGSKMGLATLVVSDQFFKIRRSWRFAERCTAVLFGAVLFMTVYAPDCKKDLDVHETFIKTVTNISWEGRRVGANDSYITGDFNVERGLLSTIWERTKNTLSHAFFSSYPSARPTSTFSTFHSSGINPATIQNKRVPAMWLMYAPLQRMSPRILQKTMDLCVKPLFFHRNREKLRLKISA